MMQLKKQRKTLIIMFIPAVVQPIVSGTATNILVSGTKCILQLKYEKHKTLFFEFIAAAVQPGVAETEKIFNL